jgi:hypothetical protein
MSSSKQFTLENKYGTELNKYTNTFFKQVNEAYSRLPPEHQNPASKAYIEEQVRNKLAPQLAYIKRLQKLGEDNGLDLSYADQYLETNENKNMPKNVPTQNSSASQYSLAELKQMREQKRAKGGQ